MSSRRRGRPRKNHYKDEQLCTEDEPCFENCGVCKETIPNDCAMLCDGICSNWYHLKCVELTDEDYISINLMADKISWFCKACDPKIKSFIKSRASSEGDQIDDINALRGTVEVLIKEVKILAHPNVKSRNELKEVIIGKKTDSFIKTIPVRPRPTRRKALFILRLCPEVSASDIEGYIKHEVTLDFVKCSQLRTKYENYASFQIEVNETDMDKVLNADIRPSGCLLKKFKGVLRKEAVINGTSSNEHFLPMEDNSQSSTQTEG
ncbi:hypothetical protein J6590_015861 [Homalodisca vitripennis]|nr:hypothetical protein J6590_015861 [Homalodisca vitripennis]